MQNNLAPSGILKILSKTTLIQYQQQWDTSRMQGTLLKVSSECKITLKRVLENENLEKLASPTYPYDWNLIVSGLHIYQNHLCP